MNRSISKLLNTVASEALDERVLNFPGKKGALNAWEIQENHNLFLNAARACGCPLLNIGPSDLQNGTVRTPRSMQRLFYVPLLCPQQQSCDVVAMSRGHSLQLKLVVPLRRSTSSSRRSGRW